MILFNKIFQPTLYNFRFFKLVVVVPSFLVHDSISQPFQLHFIPVFIRIGSGHRMHPSGLSRLLLDQLTTRLQRTTYKVHLEDNAD